MSVKIRNLLSDIFLDVLEQNDGRCLDNIEDRLVVANHLAAVTTQSVVGELRKVGVADRKIELAVSCATLTCS